MRLPELKEIPTTRDFIENFGGYNHNVRIGENEFYDMKNLTSSHYPVLATRNKRGTFLGKDTFEGSGSQIEYPVGFVNKDGLCVVTVTEILGNYQLKIRIGETIYEFEQLTDYNASHKRNVVLMGAYIVIFPDCFYINTADVDDRGSFKCEWQGEWLQEGSTLVDQQIHFFPCAKDGQQVFIYKAVNKNDNPNFLATLDDEDKTIADGPANTLMPKYIVEEVSGDLYYWSSTLNSWCTYRPYLGIKREGADFTSKFKVGDGVRFTDFSEDENGTMKLWDKRIFEDLFNNDIERPFAVSMVSDDTIILDYKLACFRKYVEAHKDGVYSSSYNTTLKISKIIPIMDYVIESNNRLWGCRCGINVFGETVNEIYASRLGDFTNWESFPGTSTDSYTVSVGSEGDFTGAISYLGMPLFFKQNRIHTIYGNYPATYQLQTTECKGVQKGCADSLAVVNGAVLYKSVRGVCAYSGSLPTDIGYALNEQKLSYKDAFASEYKGKYYLSMVDENDKRQLFVYDIDKGVWHKEGDFEGAECFCLASLDGFDALYYLYSNQDEGGNIERTVKVIEGYGEYTDNEKIGWMAETGVLGCSSPDKKYISRISIRLSVGIGTRIYVSAEYDSSGTWERIGAIVGTSLNTFTFPIRPKRCDHLRLRIEGTDEARIYSISKTYEQGSDM